MAEFVSNKLDAFVAKIAGVGVGESVSDDADGGGGGGILATCWGLFVGAIILFFIKSSLEAFAQMCVCSAPPCDCFALGYELRACLLGWFAMTASACLRCFIGTPKSCGTTPSRRRKGSSEPRLVRRAVLCRGHRKTRARG